MKPDANPEPLPRDRDPDEIQMQELSGALCGLVMLGDDPFLRMQATNIAMIDKWLMSLEIETLQAQAEDERPDITSALFLNAQSQMWLFALYELLRTWRERAKKVQKWVANGGLPLKIADLRKDRSFLHVSNAAFADQLERVAADPAAFVARIEDDLARVHVLLGQLEFLRVALAKHEVSGKSKQLAYAPGYARIDMWTGSMSYQLSNAAVILGQVTRRSFADGLRLIAVDRRVPSQEERDQFDVFIKLTDADDPFSFEPMAQKT